MRVTILGSGTLIPADARHSAAHVVAGSGFVVLMDCGSGTVHGLDRHGIAWHELTHLAISHFHTDHVGDVAALLWAFRNGLPAPRTRPLWVLGPPGLAAFMEGLAGAFGEFVRDPGFPVEVVEMARRDRWESPGGGLVVSTHPTVHTDRSVAFRVESGGEAVGYTGDAGPDEALFSFFEGVDVMISECCDPDPPADPNHLTPSGVARLGRAARPRALVTTHVYPPLDPAAIPDLVRGAGYPGVVTAGFDGLVIDMKGLSAG